MDLFRNVRGCDTVQLFDGCGFRVTDLPACASGGRLLVVLVSQSGETRDLAACLESIRASESHRDKAVVLAVVNQQGSLIDRAADRRMYTRSGREVGVAATKSFMNQCVALALLAAWLSTEPGKNEIIMERVVRDMHILPCDLQQVIEMYGSDDGLARDLLPEAGGGNSLFIVSDGRSGEGCAMEAALKMKEIALVHAEASSWNALKHGPFALLGDTPVIVVRDASNKHRAGVFCEQVLCRGSPLILVGPSLDDADAAPRVLALSVPENESFSGLLGVVVLQLMAYNIATRRGIDCDHPRNLAKTCTV
jgi:glucosamine--fructose-6-phosphate aminotransferase (isomerizing)